MLEAKSKCPGLAVSKRGNKGVLGSHGRERQELVCHAGQQCSEPGISPVKAAAGTHGTHTAPVAHSRASLRCWPALYGSISLPAC